MTDIRPETMRQLQELARTEPYVARALDALHQSLLTEAEAFALLFLHTVRQNAVLRGLVEELQAYRLPKPFIVSDIWEKSPTAPGEPGLRIQEAPAPEQVDYEGFIATGVRGSGKTAAQLREMRRRGGF